MNPYPKSRTRRINNLIDIYRRKLFHNAGGHIQLHQKNELLRVYTNEQFMFIQKYLIRRGQMMDFHLKVNLNMDHFFCL